MPLLTKGPSQAGVDADGHSVQLKQECTLVLSVNNGVHTRAERASDIAQKEASAWL